MSDGPESASFVLTFEKKKKKVPLMFRHIEGTLAPTPEEAINKVIKPA